MLPMGVQRVWQTEGIEGPADLVTFYTSAAELRAHLGKHKLTDEDVNSGVLAWRDAPRALASLVA